MGQAQAVPTEIAGHCLLRQAQSSVSRTCWDPVLGTYFNPPSRLRCRCQADTTFVPRSLLIPCS